MPRQRENSLRTPRSSYRLRAGYRLKRDWTGSMINFVDEDGIETGAIDAVDDQDQIAEDKSAPVSGEPDDTDVE